MPKAHVILSSIQIYLFAINNWQCCGEVGRVQCSNGHIEIYFQLCSIQSFNKKDSKTSITFNPYQRAVASRWKVAIVFILNKNSAQAVSFSHTCPCLFRISLMWLIQNAFTIWMKIIRVFFYSIYWMQMQRILLQYVIYNFTNFVVLVGHIL